MMDASERHEHLYRRHVDAVYRYALRRDPGAAEDVVADVFLVAWRRLDDVPAEAELAWLLGVARRVLANGRRSGRRQEALRERLAREREPLGAGPLDGLLVDAAIHQALACLPERDRELLLLIAWEDLDHSTVARVMGCTSANVAVRLHRAKRRLARELRRLDDGAPEIAGPKEEPTRA
jgi:RNA polymerase sigma-70 factor (ECF subfamily)